MEYAAGDVIVYRPFGGGLRRVLVEERLEDVKKGRPGFDGVVVSGPEKGQPVWGYDCQIVPLQVIHGPTEHRPGWPAIDDSSPGAA